MSWDADLDDRSGHSIGSWNYTHNTSPMIYAVLDEAGMTSKHSWWADLNGMSGPEGAGYLDRIIRGLEADPDRFRVMNPENGWGNYDSLVKVLTEMRNAVPEWPTTWTCWG